MESKRLFFLGRRDRNVEDDDGTIVVDDDVEVNVDGWLLLSFVIADDIVVMGWAASSSPKCNCPLANSTCANMARFSAALM